MYMHQYTFVYDCFRLGIYLRSAVECGISCRHSLSYSLCFSLCGVCVCVRITVSACVNVTTLMCVSLLASLSLSWQMPQCMRLFICSLLNEYRFWQKSIQRCYTFYFSLLGKCMGLALLRSFLFVDRSRSRALSLSLSYLASIWYVCVCIALLTLWKKKMMTATTITHYNINFRLRRYYRMYDDDQCEMNLLSVCMRRSSSIQVDFGYMRHKTTTITTILKEYTNIAMYETAEWKSHWQIVFIGYSCPKYSAIRWNS